MAESTFSFLNSKAAGSTIVLTLTFLTGVLSEEFGKRIKVNSWFASRDLLNSLIA